MAGHGLFKFVFPLFGAIAVLMIAFQNCSEPLPADTGDSNENSSLGLATPTPAPLYGQYYPNPAVVGAQITIMAIGGTGTYTFSKTNGAGNLNGNIYQAPSMAESAIITITDSSGKSYPLQIAIYAAAPSPTPSASPSPAATPTPSPTPGLHGTYTQCGETTGKVSCVVPNPQTGQCSCPAGSAAVVQSTSPRCTFYGTHTLEIGSATYACN